MTRPPEFTSRPTSVQQVGTRVVHGFGTGEGHRDDRTISSFGAEWEKFNAFDAAEIEHAGNEYFDIVPPALLGPEVLALDLGCGSGRWTRYLSSRVGHVDAIDPSEAVVHAARVHGDLEQVRWIQAGVDNMPVPDGAYDLVICLGVLHHVPDTAGALAKLAAKVRPGGHLLLYLYYALDDRGPLYRAVFRASDLVRAVISRLPGGLKRLVCDLIAFTVYLPLRTLARLLRDLKVKGWERLPLAFYHDKSLTVLRNDALDRFGTPLEQRFTKEEMAAMMEAAGLSEVRFSEHPPYWHALGRR
ncbi:MAG TPA: class I SAM-dependent methyltransferase [Flavobacteriales bacterium]|nr:class I SAM-dependent methyltransferase [Flavobacteriales bacterium]